MKINKLFFGLVFLVLLFLIFPRVFLLVPIAGGDYINFWPENILNFKNYAFAAWDPNINLGWSTVGLLHYAPYSFLTGWIGYLLGENILLWERIVWWLPFFVLSFFSINKLFKLLFPQNRFWFFAPIIFVFNTYVLMVLGGGQIAGLGVAYAIAPFVLAVFIKHIDAAAVQSRMFSSALWAGLVLAIQIMLDLRIAYVTIIAIGLYFIVSSSYSFKKINFKQVLLRILNVFFIPLGVAGLLHAFWLIPTVLFRVNTIEQLGSAYSSVAAVKFFSFATFENSLSLLHPNWPENIFGKTYFMRPEFLLLPVLAFSSLLFLRTQFKKIIVFFALLGLLGAFLAKGANEPFGVIYLWMFEHVPGFIMFRDATKWYVLIAIAYSVLIPFSIWHIYEWLNSKLKFKAKNYFSYIFLFFIFCFLLFLIRPAFLGQLGGTFKPADLKQEQIQLKNCLAEQQAFSRTLWLPHRGKFAYFSNTHPAIDADAFFQVSSAAGVLTILKDAQNEELLQTAGVKFVILPEDSEKELFLKNSKYDDKLYQAFRKELKNISWLKKSQQFGAIEVYEVASPKDKFWQAVGKSTITYQTINPTTYRVKISDAKKGEIMVFNEAYDPNWLATDEVAKSEISSKPYRKMYNSFVIPSAGQNEFTIAYAPQQLVNRGGWISLATLLITGIVLLRKKL